MSVRPQLLEFITRSQHFNLPALSREDIAQVARLYVSAMEQHVEPDLVRVIHCIQLMKAVLYPSQEPISREMVAYIIADNQI